MVASAHRPNIDHLGEAGRRELTSALRDQVRGEVRFDVGSRAVYAYGLGSYRQVPIGVVLPRSIDDVEAALAVCRRYDVPVVARGAGTDLSGAACNVAVVFDYSKYMRQILALDVQQQRARIEPGVVVDVLRQQANAHGLTFAVDPPTHTHCTIGGVLGNNACGVHGMKGGTTLDNVEELDVITYDGVRLRVGATSDVQLAHIIAAGGRRGAIYAQLRDLRDRHAATIRARLSALPRQGAGYNLDQLLPENGFNVARALVGSASTCVGIVEATVRLVPRPPHRVLLMLGYPDLARAAEDVPEILRVAPSGMEAVDDQLGRDVGNGTGRHPLPGLPEGRAWLLVEFAGESIAAAETRAATLLLSLSRGAGAPSTRLVTEAGQVRQIWAARETSLHAAVASTPGAIWEHAVVPPERLGAYLRGYARLLEAHGYNAAVYGHFAQGCVHSRIDVDRRVIVHAARLQRLDLAMVQLVQQHGGTMAGDGDPARRAALFTRLFGAPLVEAFGAFKTIWDPQHRMNPDKKIDVHGADFAAVPERLSPVLTGAARCVGAGSCRSETAGTMCPSYRVTHAEEHSPRGRSHLLREALEGRLSGRGWRDPHVKAALDLCLGCKGCKSECPVNVDVASYKAEFLAHFYRWRPRPRQAYAMGLIFVWARLAAWAPRLVNNLLQAPLIGRVLKFLAGIAQPRALPRFAPQTFRQWFHARPLQNVGRPKVILWADTFSNHFHPTAAQAAVEVLETAGFQVTLPVEPLCCGRPLYNAGMLDRAKLQLREIMLALMPEILHGVPLVGLEPSCISVFRDELTSLFPHDAVARTLAKQSFLLGEFLEHYASDFPWPKLDARALVHGHCHQKVAGGMAADEALLKKLGLAYEILDAGCCGMAGSFGMEKEHYDVSIRCAERVLAPAVRRTPRDTMIITNGYSCSEQIAHTTQRRAVHLAEVLQFALRSGTTLETPAYPPEVDERLPALDVPGPYEQPGGGISS